MRVYKTEKPNILRGKARQTLGKIELQKAHDYLSNILQESHLPNIA